MASYKELVEQRQALEAQIETARKAEIGEAVAKIRQICAEYDLTEKDVFGGARSPSEGKSSRKGSVVAPKYRDPNTGATWTGRGKAPLWIAGADREKFLIA